MSKLRKTGKLIMNIIEEYIPMIAFAWMFICFVIQILFRYVFKSPQSWTYEMTSICFIWVIMLGSCLALRDNAHVVFSLVYDDRSRKTQRIMDIISNGLCVVLFSAFMPATFKYMVAQSKQQSPILKLSYVIIYGPFFVMMIITIGRQILNIVKAVRDLRTPEAKDPEKLAAGSSAASGEASK